MKEKRDEFAEKLDKLSETRFKDMRGTVLGLTFAGLTVAYKEGMIDFLTEWGSTKDEEDVYRAAYSAALGGAGILTDVTGIMEKIFDPAGARDETKETITEKWARAEANYKKLKEDIAKEREAARGNPDSLSAISKVEARLDKWITEVRMAKAKFEAIRWMWAMGMAGGTIYLLQETSVTQLIENIPFIE
jgi:hypothetical protein